MPPLDLDAIRRRCAAASKGPWEAVWFPMHHSPEMKTLGVDSPKGIVFTSLTVGGIDETNANAEFTAHARTDVPLLLEEILRLRAQRDKYREALRKIAKPALGGKQQQYTAQAALTPAETKDS